MTSRRHPVCKWIVIIFLLLYLAALVLFGIGTFGLFGNERDPLAGVFLIPLGIPWIYLLDFKFLPEGSLIWLSALSPLINLVLIRIICSMFRK